MCIMQIFGSCFYPTKQRPEAIGRKNNCFCFSQGPEQAGNAILSIKRMGRLSIVRLSKEFSDRLTSKAGQLVGENVCWSILEFEKKY